MGIPPIEPIKPTAVLENDLLRRTQQEFRSSGTRKEDIIKQLKDVTGDILSFITQPGAIVSASTATASVQQMAQLQSIRAGITSFLGRSAGRAAGQTAARGAISMAGGGGGAVAGSTLAGMVVGVAAFIVVVALVFYFANLLSEQAAQNAERRRKLEEQRQAAMKAWEEIHKDVQSNPGMFIPKRL